MADAAVHGDAHETRGFFTRWLMSTNHKDIGILYLFTAAAVGLISVGFTAFVLFTSGKLDPQYERFVERRLREEFGFVGSPVNVEVRAREKRKR